MTYATFPFVLPVWLQDETANVLWPTPLHALVEQYGAARVFHEGLAVLGYPPLWANTAFEFAIIKVRLKKWG